MKKKPATKAGKKAKVKKTMGEFKRGSLHSGSKSGPKVTSPEQAIAIALSQSGQSKKGGVVRKMKKSKANPKAAMKRGAKGAGYKD